MAGEPLTMWVVYKRPRDRPDVAYLARRWAITHGAMHASEDVLVGDSVEAVRAQLPPGLHRLCRADSDDDVIVESWI